MLIMALLIFSLMTVVGVFLTSSVARFFMDDFANQMRTAFESNVELVDALREAAGSENAPQQLSDRLVAYQSALGFTSSGRGYFILDGKTASVLKSSGGGTVDLLGNDNVISALSGKVGITQSVAANYFDCAVPITSYDGEQTYIIYIRDTKSGMTVLSRSLFYIIMQAVLLGIAITVLLALLLSKTMTTPIENLTYSARRVASGDFSSKLSVHSRDEIGVLTDTFNNMADVLENTMAEVRGERDKLSTLFLRMTDGVAAFSHTGELVHVNLAALQMLGIDSPEKLNLDIFNDAVSAEEIAELRPPNFLERGMRRGNVELKLYFAPFGADDAESGLMVVLHDNTEQYRLDELRREFVSNVSHELRTPLTGIKSYAETLLEPEDLTYENIRGFSRVIVDETDRMTRLVRDLLILSRFDYDKMDLRREHYSLNGILDRITGLMQTEAAAHGHTLTLEKEQLCELYGDADRVEQVIINILSNAITYTPENGKIRLHAWSGDGGVFIEIKDNGIGIPPEDLPYVFDRFYRVDKARSRAKGGTGLGLAIAREIVESQGGRISVESKTGEGTAVLVYLPELSG